MPAVTLSNEGWHQDDVRHVLDPDGRSIARARLPPETRLRLPSSSKPVTCHSGLGDLMNDYAAQAA